MSRRITEPVQSEELTGPMGGRRDTHPAFGVATVTRSTSTGHALFQSDVIHHETINLVIARGERQRDLSRDWTFQREDLVEVEFSLAQWGALVSSIGIGSGVPCTLRRTEKAIVPDLPYQPRLAESIAEVKASANKLAEKSVKTLADLQVAVASGKIGAIKVALRAHELSIQHIESNAVFHAKSMVRAAETVVAQAKSDIEAHVLGAQRLVGGASIEAPTIGVLEVEAGE